MFANTWDYQVLIEELWLMAIWRFSHTETWTLKRNPLNESMLKLEKRHKFIKQIHKAYVLSQLSCLTASMCHSHLTAGTFSVPQSTLKNPEIRQQSGFKQTLEEKAQIMYDGRLEVMHGGMEELVLSVRGNTAARLLNPLLVSHTSHGAWLNERLGREHRQMWWYNHRHD